MEFKKKKGFFERLFSNKFRYEGDSEFSEWGLVGFGEASYEDLYDIAVDEYSRLLSSNTKGMKLISEEQSQTFARVFNILNNYHTDSNYILTMFSSQNVDVTFNIRAQSFLGVDKDVVTYFRNTAFPRTLFKKESKKVASNLQIQVFKDLFGINPYLFFEIFKDNRDMKATIRIYNDEVVSSRLGNFTFKGASEQNIKEWEFDLQELFEFNWVYSVITLGIEEKGESLSDGDIHDLLKFVSDNFKQKFKVKNIMTIIDKFNDSEAIETLTACKELSETKEYLLLDTSFKEDTLNEIFNHVFEPIFSETENNILQDKQMVEEFKTKLLNKEVEE